MKNLKFNQLLILSNSEKQGNVFQFQSHLNLVTALDNNVGKSTIVKLLFWTLGCDLAFDTNWERLDCRTIVKFQIGHINYKAMRYKNMISLKEENKPVESYSKITGEYAQRFAEIINFTALLKNREDNLEIPPPAYYFLPYYIDQKKSWTKPWDSFENLGQYEKWKAPIVKYHVGLLTPEHFKIENDKYEKRATQKTLIEEIKKIDIALSIVATHTPQLSEAVTIDEEKFNLMTEEIKEDLVKLASEQELLLDSYSKAESERAFLENQKTVAEKVIQELELDYQFSVENIENDDVECPLCGTVHLNTAVERASILTDKKSAESQLVNIVDTLKRIQNTLSKDQAQLKIIREKIDALNSKYVTEDNKNQAVGLSTIIESIAGKSIQQKVTDNKNEKVIEERGLEKAIKELNKDQKDIQSAELIKEIYSFFNETFIKYAYLLNTEDVNLSAINSPLDYNKVVKEGGAAENVRVTLAYNLAIYSVVEKFSNGGKSSFILDTPNQHEQSNTNYDSIIKLILESFPKHTQIIMCAMYNEHLKPFEEKAHVITLTNDKLINSEQFENVKTEFDNFSI